MYNLFSRAYVPKFKEQYIPIATFAYFLPITQLVLLTSSKISHSEILKTRYVLRSLCTFLLKFPILIYKNLDKSPIFSLLEPIKIFAFIRLFEF